MLGGNRVRERALGKGRLVFCISLSPEHYLCNSCKLISDFDCYFCLFCSYQLTNRHGVPFGKSQSFCSYDNYEGLCVRTDTCTKVCLSFKLRFVSVENSVNCTEVVSIPRALFITSIGGHVLFNNVRNFVQTVGTHYQY